MRYYGVQNEVKAYCNRLQNETSITVTPSLVKTLNDRVESLKKSGVWSQFGLGFNDNDGDSYLQRASVTNILGRSEVLWFVRGMKSLGLWQNMVCWPLRSYQNIGTGSTAFSLGGLGLFNLTIQNSPAWGPDGIVSTSVTNQGAQAPGTFINYINTTPRFQIYSAWNFNVSDYTTGVDALFGNSAGIILAKRGGRTVTGRRNTNASNINYVTDVSNEWHDAQYNSFTTGSQLFVDGVSRGTDNYNSVQNAQTTDISICRSCSSGTGTSTQPIAIFIFGSEINSYYLIRSLYKQTLGSNLGLP